MSETDNTLRILAIDDQELLLGSLRAMLEHGSHQVLTACSGPAGLTLAERELPDVILLDIQMPEMNGLQVLQVLRQSPLTAGIPVIILTASKEADLLEQAFLLGADDYLYKPFNVFELQARIRHQTRLKQATTEALYLQHLNRLKEDFIAVLSHELRTPLTAILGFTELLLSGVAGPLTPEQVQFLEIVMQRSGDLHHLIEQLLEFNLIKSGRRRFFPTPVDLCDLLQRSATAVRILVEQNELLLHLYLPEQPLSLLADPEALRRVLAVLLSNAIKFTPAGGAITLEALAGDAQVTIRVSDTGIGIPPESLPLIFDSFRQLEPHSTRRYEGMGLGLSIAKHLVEMHGGRIWAESRDASGSTFTVAFPRQDFGDPISEPGRRNVPLVQVPGGRPNVPQRSA